MLKKFLKEVVILIAGKQAEDISDLLHSKKHVNEFLIAKKMDMTINQTRNILYKLSDNGLVSSIRKKDKRKGWYTYFWKIEVIKALEFYKNLLLKNMDQIKNQIKSRETKSFYVCERCSIELNEENALLNDFTCMECGNIFTVRDNKKFLRDLKRGLDKFAKELETVENEIQKERDSLEKVKLKELKKIEKEKAAKSSAKKKATAKKKVEKKNPPTKASKKKTVKKKTPKKKTVKKTPKKK